MKIKMFIIFSNLKTLGFYFQIRPNKQNQSAFAFLFGVPKFAEACQKNSCVLEPILLATFSSFSPVCSFRILFHEIYETDICKKKKIQSECILSEQ